MIPLAAAKWSLGPLLLLQGRRVRRTTPVLPEAAGPREGEHGEGAALSILVTGDSAAAGLGAATQEEALAGRVVHHLGPRFRVTWRVQARTGATTAGTIRHLSRLPAFAVDAVVTSLGVNDVTGGMEAGEFVAGQARLRALLRERFGARLVVVSGLPPMHRFPALPQPLRWYLGAKARELDGALADSLAGEAGACHLPFDSPLEASTMATDGFHPGPPVYESWGRAAAARIAEFLAPPG